MLAYFRGACLALALSFGAVAADDAAAQSGHPPGSFIISAAEDALANDPGGVWEFAIWRETPQGVEFWRAEARTLEAGGALSGPARSALTGWLDAARAGEGSAVPPTFVLSAARRAATGDADGIISFVTWSETPQGHSYWSSQYDYALSGKPIYPLAQRTLENWIARSGG